MQAICNRFPFRPFAGIFRAWFAVTLACASPVSGKEEPGLEKELDGFFELGLPDVNGAKWVKVESHDEEPVIPGTFASNSNDAFSGNGWLLSERKGRVEVLQSQGQVIRARRYREGSRSPDEWDTTKEAVLRQADLGHDMKVFPKALQESARSNNAEFPQEREHLVAAALLFLAELQRHGHADFVRRTLPEVLALAPSREQAFAAARALVGEGRLDVIVSDWLNGGQTAAAADALDALVAKFPEGWADREAVRLLAARMRRQEAAPLAGDPDAKEAAEFLMKRTESQIDGFPLDNWLIPHQDEQERYVRGSGAFVKAGGKETDGALAVFLAKRRETAAALVKLVDDRRFLRPAVRRPTNERGSGYFSHDGSEPGASTGSRYDQLRRPGELGELAWRMLTPLLPENVQGGVEWNPEHRAKLVSDWIGKVMAMNDEELAWFYLHAERREDIPGFYGQDTFLRALDYLTEHGGPETLAKVRDVLLDSGAWDDLKDGGMLVRVEEFLKRSHVDAAFADQLRTAVKTGLDAHEKSMGKAMGEWEKQHLPDTRSAWAKMLELVIRHPGGLLEKFTAIAAMAKDERGCALRAIEAGLAKWPPAEVKAAVFQAVAVAETAEARRDLVGFLLDSYEPKGDWGNMSSDEVRYDEAPPLPADATTRGAMLALLRDESPFQDDSLAHGKSTVADFTANAIFSLGTGGDRRSKWETAVSRSARYLTTKWIRAQAMAMAAGDPVPPLPNPAKVSTGKTSALIRQLRALPPGRVAGTLTSKTPDEQLAVLARLDQVETWPAELVKAHFTIDKVSGGEITNLGSAWKGLQLDEKLIREIAAAVQDAAVAGKYFTVTASIAGMLSGCEIQVEASTGGMTPQAFRDAGFPGLADRPTPRAVCMLSIESGFFGSPQWEPRFGFPVWKDAAATKAWRSEHAHAPPAPDEPNYYYSEEGRKRIPANPAAFEEKLRECIKMSSYIRDPLRLTIQATGIDGGQSAVPDAKSQSVADYSGPIKTYQTVLAAIKRDDLAAAKACCTIP